jgi:hypothetical protein
VFNKKLYQNLVPDNPGGGTVSTNPWEVMSIILKTGRWWNSWFSAGD